MTEYNDFRKKVMDFIISNYNFSMTYNDRFGLKCNKFYININNNKIYKAQEFIEVGEYYIRINKLFIKNLSDILLECDTDLIIADNGDDIATKLYFTNLKDIKEIEETINTELKTIKIFNMKYKINQINKDFV